MPYSPLLADGARLHRQRHGRRLPRGRPPRVPGSGRQDRPGRGHRHGRRVGGLRRHRRRQPPVGRGRRLARRPRAAATTGSRPAIRDRCLGAGRVALGGRCCRCSPWSSASSSTRSGSCAELGRRDVRRLPLARLHLARADRVRSGIPAVGPAACAPDRVAGVVRRARSALLGLVVLRRGRGQRRDDAPIWWRVVGAPLSAERRRRRRSRAGSGSWSAGRPGRSRPGPVDLSRAYTELLRENLGQPGFRELLLTVHDLDMRRDFVFAMLGDRHRRDFFRVERRARRRSSAVGGLRPGRRQPRSPDGRRAGRREPAGGDRASS